MNERRAVALARRQGELMARSTMLRAQLAQHSQPWQQALSQVDTARSRVQGGWLWLRAHPEVPAAAAALLLVLRPRRTLRLAWRWGRRGVFAWQLWRRYAARPALAPALQPLQQLISQLAQRWLRRFTTPR